MVVKKYVKKIEKLDNRNEIKKLHSFFICLLYILKL